jgi:LPS-assembly protein
VIKNKFFPLKILFIFLALSGPALAGTPWNLDADRILVRDDENIMEAFGNVHLTRMDNYLQADYARLYTDTNWLYLRGNISAYWDHDFLEGDEAELDLKNNVGWLKNGQVFMADPHMYITGERLEKTGENTYSFSQGTMTSCDGDVPPWSIKSSRGKINVDGYAGLWHPRFRVKDHSVLYSPYLIVPVKTERQSGFLIPDLGYESGYGTNINLPYYHVIDDQRDATFYTNYFSDRGVMLGLEYRHTPNLLSRGLWRADWMRDREKHDTADNEPSRFDDDGLFRPNRDRYWLRGKFDGNDPTTGWSYKIDLDYVSDQNYLREFKSGHSGFDHIRDEFLDSFGRDIQDHDRLIRTSIVSAARNWNHLGLDARLVYSDNLRYKNRNLPSGQNPTLQRFPEINLNLFRTRIGSTPFEIDASNQAVYFWREQGTRASRIDLHPRIRMPLISTWGTLTPRLGWRQTSYYVDEFENDPAGRNTDDHFQTKGIYDFNLNAYTNLYRIFELRPIPDAESNSSGKSSWTRIKHSITPEIDYDFIPKMNQDKYPRFDSSDRISPREELTYSLSNVFTRRKDDVTQAGSRAQPSFRTSYRDFFRLKFEQSYDFREARRREDRDRFSRRPFSDVLTEMEFNPGRFISFRNKTWYSLYEKRVTEHEHRLSLTWPEKMTAWFSLDFLEQINEFKRRINDKTSIMEIGTTLDFFKNWRFNLVYRSDLDTGKDLEKSLGITYLHQCYSLELNIVDTDYDYKYEVRINLLNLGSFGG